MTNQQVITVPPTVAAITPAWLTSALKSHAGLGDSVVASVTAETAPRWNVADTGFLDVRYEGELAAGTPSRLFVKITREADPFAHLFPGEYAFYHEAHGQDLPLARCFGAFRDDATGATCILLEDLRGTHVETPWPLPPSAERCEQAVVVLAKLHARWSSSDYAHADIEKNESGIAAIYESLLPGFFDRLGDRVPQDRRTLLETVYERIGSLKRDRLAQGLPLTRIHGDAHFWNALYPVDPGLHQCVWIDWEDWRTDIAASDLAMMMALHWYPDRRGRYETGLLRKYWETTGAAGVDDLGWDQLLLDYRLGHLCNAIVPVFQEQMNHPHASWWSHLERWFMAFEDLDCRELI